MHGAVVEEQCAARQHLHLHRKRHASAKTRAMGLPTAPLSRRALALWLPTPAPCPVRRGDDNYIIKAIERTLDFNINQTVRPDSPLFNPAARCVSFHSSGGVNPAVAHVCPHVLRVCTGPNGALGVALGC